MNETNLLKPLVNNNQSNFDIIPLSEVNNRLHIIKNKEIRGVKAQKKSTYTMPRTFISTFSDITNTLDSRACKHLKGCNKKTNCLSASVYDHVHNVCMLGNSLSITKIPGPISSGAMTDSDSENSSRPGTTGNSEFILTNFQDDDSCSLDNDVTLGISEQNENILPYAHPLESNISDTKNINAPVSGPLTSILSTILSTKVDDSESNSQTKLFSVQNLASTKSTNVINSDLCSNNFSTSAQLCSVGEKNYSADIQNPNYFDEENHYRKSVQENVDGAGVSSTAEFVSTTNELGFPIKEEICSSDDADSYFSDSEQQLMSASTEFGYNNVASNMLSVSTNNSEFTANEEVCPDFNNEEGYSSDFEHQISGSGQFGYNNASSDLLNINTTNEFPRNDEGGSVFHDVEDYSSDYEHEVMSESADFGYNASSHISNISTTQELKFTGNKTGSIFHDVEGYSSDSDHQMISVGTQFGYTTTTSNMPDSSTTQKTDLAIDEEAGSVFGDEEGYSSDFEHQLISVGKQFHCSDSGLTKKFDKKLDYSDCAESQRQNAFVPMHSTSASVDTNSATVSSLCKELLMSDKYSPLTKGHQITVQTKDSASDDTELFSSKIELRDDKYNKNICASSKISNYDMCDNNLNAASKSKMSINLHNEDIEVLFSNIEKGKKCDGQYSEITDVQGSELNNQIQSSKYKIALMNALRVNSGHQTSNQNIDTKLQKPVMQCSNLNNELYAQLDNVDNPDYVTNQKTELCNKFTLGMDEIKSSASDALKVNNSVKNETVISANKKTVNSDKVKNSGDYENNLKSECHKHLNADISVTGKNNPISHSIKRELPDHCTSNKYGKSKSQKISENDQNIIKIPHTHDSDTEKNENNLKGKCYEGLNSDVSNIENKTPKPNTLKRTLSDQGSFNDHGEAKCRKTSGSAHKILDIPYVHDSDSDSKKHEQSNIENITGAKLCTNMNKEQLSNKLFSKINSSVSINENANSESGGCFSKDHACTSENMVEDDTKINLSELSESVKSCLELLSKMGTTITAGTKTISFDQKTKFQSSCPSSNDSDKTSNIQNQDNSSSQTGISSTNHSVLSKEKTLVKVIKSEPCALQDSKIEPCALQDSKIEPCALQDIKIEPCALQDIKIEPYALQDIKIEPCALQDIKIEPCALQDIEIEPSVLQSIKIEPCVLQDVKSEPCDLQDQTIEPCDPQDQMIEPCTLQDQMIQPYALQDVKIETCALQDVKIEPYALQDVKIEPYALQDVKVEPYTLQDVKVEPYTLQDVKIEPCALQDVKIETCALKDVKIEPSVLKDAKIEPTVLKDVKVEISAVNDIKVETSDVSSSKPCSNPYSQPDGNISSATQQTQNFSNAQTFCNEPHLTVKNEDKIETQQNILDKIYDIPVINTGSMTIIRKNIVLTTYTKTEISVVHNTNVSNKTSKKLSSKQNITVSKVPSLNTEEKNDYGVESEKCTGSSSMSMVQVINVNTRGKELGNNPEETMDQHLDDATNNEEKTSDVCYSDRTSKSDAKLCVANNTKDAEMLCYKVPKIEFCDHPYTESSSSMEGNKNNLQAKVSSKCNLYSKSTTSLCTDRVCKLPKFDIKSNNSVQNFDAKLYPENDVKSANCSPITNSGTDFKPDKQKHQDILEDDITNKKINSGTNNWLPKNSRKLLNSDDKNILHSGVENLTAPSTSSSIKMETSSNTHIHSKDNQENITNDAPKLTSEASGKSIDVKPDVLDIVSTSNSGKEVSLPQSLPDISNCKTVSDIQSIKSDAPLVFSTANKPVESFIDNAAKLFRNFSLQIPISKTFGSEITLTPIPDGEASYKNKQNSKDKSFLLGAASKSIETAVDSAAKAIRNCPLEIPISKSFASEITLTSIVEGKVSYENKHSFEEIRSLFSTTNKPLDTAMDIAEEGTENHPFQTAVSESSCAEIILKPDTVLDVTAKGIEKHPFQTPVPKNLDAEITLEPAMEVKISYQESSQRKFSLRKQDSEFRQTLAFNPNNIYRFGHPNMHPLRSTNETTFLVHMFKCNKCDKTFFSEKHRELHQIVHINEYSFKCNICDKVFSRSESLRLHQEVHSVIRTSKKKTKLSDRSETVAGVSPGALVSLLKSSISSSESKKNIAVAQHDVFNYKCEQCNENFLLKEYLELHIRIEHKHPLKCNACYSSFDSSDALILHEEACSAFLTKQSAQGLLHENQNTCETLGFKPSSSCPSALKKHMLIHQTKLTYKCSECDKTFMCEKSLRDHQVVHSDERPFHCVTCGESYKTKSSLSVHEQTHSEEKPNECHMCDEKFDNLTKLKVHYLKHTKEQPYSCDICHKSFGLRKALNRHLTVHSDAREFLCEFCGKRFQNNTLLQRHRSIHLHGKKFKCDVCDKMFNFANSLFQHLLTHSDKRVHACKLCDKKFKLPHRLRQHEKTHELQSVA